MLQVNDVMKDVKNNSNCYFRSFSSVCTSYSRTQEFNIA